jgi:hypothetical protein
MRQTAPNSSVRVSSTRVSGIGETTPGVSLVMRWAGSARPRARYMSTADQFLHCLTSDGSAAWFAARIANAS